MTRAEVNPVGILLAEIFHDAHRYAPGLEQRRPTLVAPQGPRWRRLAAREQDRWRDLIERVAARAGFSHRHFDPREAAERLERLIELSDGLSVTYGMLGDEASRRAFLDVLKLRVLGPYHAPLPITPSGYRARQAYAERELRRQEATFEVSDPWFSPLSLYETPSVNGSHITMHSHSVDLVSVYLLDQYSYSGEGVQLRASAGDLVLDVGGCWGDTALYFAGLIGTSGEVHTLEFDPENLEIMRANLALNPELANRVKVVERALWDRSDERVEFVQAGRMTTIVDGTAHWDRRHVETLTLDDYVEEAGISRLGLVKLDVEGVELRVLAGAKESLKRFRPKLAIAAYHKDDDLVTIPQLISELGAGYTLYLKTSSPVEDETVLFAAVDQSASAGP